MTEYYVTYLNFAVVCWRNTDAPGVYNAFISVAYNINTV